MDLGGWLVHRGEQVNLQEFRGETTASSLGHPSGVGGGSGGDESWTWQPGRGKSLSKDMEMWEFSAGEEWQEVRLLIGS